jgi:hypothetical protein
MQGQKLRTPKTLPVKKFLLATTLFLSLGGLLKSQTTLVNPAGDGGFETGTTFAASNWTAVNGTQSNRWFVGTVPAGFTGARCVHISKANNGSTYLYDLTSYDVSHFYRDITFLQDNLQLHFHSKYNV